MKRRIERWQSLVHVCRRWRGLVLISPRRLNLQLYYKYGTRKSLDVWPAFPLVIVGGLLEEPADNAIAGLEHSDRISEISFNCSATSEIEKLRTAMKAPFPELTALNLSFKGMDAVFSSSSLGGSAPRLRYFTSVAILFPGVLKILSSTTHLVQLHLLKIPRAHSRYYPPEAMANCLSMLTSLKDLQLKFVSFEYSNESRRPFPPTRSVVPTLKMFEFQGVTEYLEEFVARIDAPQLHQLSITLFQYNDFKTTELSQFVSRTSTLGALDGENLYLDGCRPHVELRQSDPGSSGRRMFKVEIFLESESRQVSTLTQICALSLHVESLYITAFRYIPTIYTSRDRDIRAQNMAEWVGLLLPFTAVKNLYLSWEVSYEIVHVLKNVTGERTTEVFPALQNIFLEKWKSGETPAAVELPGIAKFISARQLINRPVAVSVGWDKYSMWKS